MREYSSGHKRQKSLKLTLSITGSAQKKEKVILKLDTVIQATALGPDWVPVQKTVARRHLVLSGILLTSFNFKKQSSSVLHKYLQIKFMAWGSEWTRIKM